MKLSAEQGHPDWDLLASWIAVIECGSVSEAGHLLKISQAAVSQRVKQLETTFETPLLDRSTRPAQPTAAGHRLFEHAKELLTRADQMMESMRNVSRAKRMIVRFGCVDSFAATVGPLIIKALVGSSHQIRLWSGITPVLDSLIESRQLDLVVSTSATSTSGISRMPLFSEDYFVVVPRDHDVVKGQSLRELSQKLQFIRYSERSFIGEQIDQYLRRNGDAIERTYEFDITDPLLSLVANGMGFAISTPLCIWQSRHYLPDIRVIPLSQFVRQGRPYPVLTRTFYLAYRQGELGNLPQEVLDLVRVGAIQHVSKDITAKLGLSQDALKVVRSLDDEPSRDDS